MKPSMTTLGDRGVDRELFGKLEQRDAAAGAVAADGHRSIGVVSGASGVTSSPGSAPAPR